MSREATASEKNKHSSLTSGLYTGNFHQIPEYEAEEWFRQELIRLGNPADPNMPIVGDGSNQRYETTTGGRNNKNGFYRFYNDGCPTGLIQDWTTNPEYTKIVFPYKDWCKNNNLSYVPLSNEKKKELEAIRKAKEEANKNQQRLKREKALNEVKAIFNNTHDVTDDSLKNHLHGYLQRKHIPNTKGLHIEHPGTPTENLLCPLYDINNELVNWTRIYPNPDKEGKKYLKRLITDAQAKDVFCVISTDGVSSLPIIPPNGPICFCEGLATGMAVFRSISDEDGIVICAGSCYNLESVAKLIANKNEYRDKEKFFFADNDWNTSLKNPRLGNPGIDHAFSAARSICVPKSHVIWPDWNKGDEDRSDWDDKLNFLIESEISSLDLLKAENKDYQITPEKIQNQVNMGISIFKNILSATIRNARNGHEGALPKGTTSKAYDIPIHILPKPIDPELSDKSLSEIPTSEFCDNNYDITVIKDFCDIKPDTIITQGIINRLLYAGFEDFRRGVERLYFTSMKPEDITDIFEKWAYKHFPKDNKGKPQKTERFAALQSRIAKGPTSGEYAEETLKEYIDQSGHLTLLYKPKIGFYKYKNGFWEKQTSTEGNEEITYVKLYPHRDVDKKSTYANQAFKRKITKDVTFNAFEVMNFPNIMLDLNNDELKEHSPVFYSTSQVHYNYDSKAKCKGWIRYLWISTNKNRKRMRILQEYVGYCLFSGLPFHKVLTLFGNGRNGKTVFFTIIKHLLGNDNVSSLKIHDMDKEFRLVELENSAVNISDDTNPLIPPSVLGVLKNATGGSELNACFKFKSHFKFVTHAKFLVSFNGIPVMGDITDSIVDRIIHVRFLCHFVEGDPSPNRKYERRLDPDLIEKLKVELPGIFNWAYRGYKRLKKNRHFSKSPDQAWFVEEYTARNSPIMQFLDSIKDHLMKDDMPVERSTKDLHLAYSDWVQNVNRQSCNHKTQRMFTAALLEALRQNHIKYEKRFSNSLTYLKIHFEAPSLYEGDDE